jgi:hypothetical protein
VSSRILMKKIVEQVPSRFRTLEEANTFLLALDANSLASPFDHGAVKPFLVLPSGQPGMNPDYQKAEYELELWLLPKIGIRGPGQGARANE